ncbi:MAG: CDP-alcohol phosphatidyltransferase family protein [Burkholderiales bacterium]|nr:MAG: CDP-alcohol phosphatidyltransferase family protein [Burkholderiales bacterium]
MNRELVNLPNAITVLRALLIPVIVYALATQRYGLGLALFVVQAVSDLADGVIARRWNLRTRFGAIADPVADKLTMLSVTLMLAGDGLVPGWLAAMVIARDVLIVFGAVAYHFLVHELEMAPSWLSKVNTGFEFIVLAAVLADAALLFEAEPWLPTAFVVVGVTIALSGAQYAWEWGLRAVRGLRGPRS